MKDLLYLKGLLKMNEYSSLKDLYIDLLPSFKVKLRLLNFYKYNLSIKDIWLYLQNTKWKYDSDLTIDEMVNDIINVDGYLIYDYKRKVQK